ncbi:MAG TPA: acireductone synthase [Candidatus Binatia bacterium]|nr:acireductone synthase [Candidatus Binatia bacterium]
MLFDLSISAVHGILLDIEGTVSPIRFVHQVLFPFVRGHLKDYLEQNLDSEELQRDLSMLREEHREDVARELVPPEWVEAPPGAQIDSIVCYVFWLMDRDRKSTGLKSLQGKIWQAGYLGGKLKAQVFEDVPPALKRWKQKNLDVRIFSSGSVLAQKLLFAHTEVGDLTDCLRGYFDTRTGPKTAEESYRRIAAEFHLRASEILFISDMAAELDAAKCAGMQTLLCVRPGNLTEPDHGYRVITSFSEIVG